MISYFVPTSGGMLIFLMVFCLIAIACEKKVGRNVLTAEEQEWLSKHDGKIVLAGDPKFAPIEFLDEKRQYRGLAADYIRLIEKKLGFKFKIVHYRNWKEIMRETQKGKIDVLNAVQKTPLRSEYLLFTRSFIEIPNMIIVRKEISQNLSLK